MTLSNNDKLLSALRQDYETTDEWLDASEELINRWGNGIAQHYWTIGNQLRSVQEALRYSEGGFTAFIDRFTWFSRASAYNYIKFASTIEFPTVGNNPEIPMRTWYALASADDEVRAEYITKVEVGETVTEHDVKQARLSKGENVPVDGITLSTGEFVPPGCKCALFNGQRIYQDGCEVHEATEEDRTNWRCPDCGVETGGEDEYCDECQEEIEDQDTNAVEAPAPPRPPTPPPSEPKPEYQWCAECQPLTKLGGYKSHVDYEKAEHAIHNTVSNRGATLAAVINIFCGYWREGRVNNGWSDPIATLRPDNVSGDRVLGIQINKSFNGTAPSPTQVKCPCKCHFTCHSTGWVKIEQGSDPVNEDGIAQKYIDMMEAAQ